jgi:hypothetical protein
MTVMLLTAMLCTTMLVGFTACGSMPATTGDGLAAQVETACATASAAVKALTVANNAGKLSPAQQTQILSAIGEVDPVCASPNPPTLDSLKMQAFLRGVSLLSAQAKRL